MSVCAVDPIRVTLTSEFVEDACLDYSEQTGGAVVLCVCDKQELVAVMGELFVNRQEIVEALNGYGFTGEYEKSVSFSVVDSKGRRVCIIAVGLGGASNLDAFCANRIGIVVFEQLCRLRRERAVVFVNVASVLGTRCAAVDYIQSMMCSFCTSDFSASAEYKCVDENSRQPPKIKNVCFVTAQDYSDEIDIEYLSKLADSIKFIKYLCVTPSNLKPPAVMSDMLKKELEQFGVEVTIKDEEELKRLGMGALLCVGQGSAQESRLVVMRWRGASPDDKDMVFVGKGVTFDTGGISIKPSKGMEEMKFDMSGAAAVVGILRLLAARKASVNAVGVIGLAENMPSGSASRPGDVVRSMSGKTIEVLNTDAEGRVVLADALWYAQIIANPIHLICLATLTGAITVALGCNVYAGLFANNDGLADLLLRCGQSTGERLWRMPMDKEYDKAISSDIADVKNISSMQGGGAITAAHFLMRFVKEGVSWAHLDIAGMAHKSTGLPPAHCKSAGFGVFLLDKFVSGFER